MDKKEPKFKVIGIPFKTVKQFAAELEKKMNELEEGGWAFQISQINNKPDMLITARRQEKHPFVEFMEAMSQHQAPPTPSFKNQKTVEIVQTVMQAVEKGAARGAAEDEVITHQVKKFDGLSVADRSEIVDDIEAFAEDHEKHHNDGSTCSLPKVLRSIAKEVRERIRATQS